MSKIKFIILGYVLAICFNSCDSVIGSSDEIIISDLEYGDYGTVSWKPLYVRIVD